MVNSQFVSSSGRRLFYVSPCTSRYHLSQKALLSDRHEGNVQERRSFQRTTEVNALCSIHQFDGKDMFQVVHHFIKVW